MPTLGNGPGDKSTGLTAGTAAGGCAGVWAVGAVGSEKTAPAGTVVFEWDALGWDSDSEEDGEQAETQMTISARLAAVWMMFFTSMSSFAQFNNQRPASIRLAITTAVKNTQ